MTKFFPAVPVLAVMTLAAAAFPAGAIAAPERSFTRDGQTFVYRTAEKNGRVVITGRSLPSGSAFRLVVRGNSVTGVSGGTPVSFTVPNAQAKIMMTEVAARSG